MSNTLLVSVATLLKERWLEAPPVVSLRHNEWKEFHNFLFYYLLPEVDCRLDVYYVEAQPYASVDELREDVDSGRVLYRTLNHPLLGQIYNIFRAYHDVVNHGAQGCCFGLPGEMKSAHDLLCRNARTLTTSNEPWFVDSLIISDVLLPNLLYSLEGGWGDYSYTKVVQWYPEHVNLAIELSACFTSGSFVASPALEAAYAEAAKL